MLKTSHLQCFVAVAEELHFGRAAVRLGMTQPPLTRQIQLLEKELGCELLSRGTRSVDLTSAGRLFLPEAQRILRLIEAASANARDASDGRQGTIGCGFTAASAYDYLPGLVHKIAEHLPRASLVMREMVSARQVAALESGELDIGLLRPPLDPATYHWRVVVREPMILALPRGHQLLSRRAVYWRDLDRQPLLMYDARDARYFYDLVVSRCVSEGAYPRYVQHLSQIHTILSLVRTGLGVAVVPASARILNVAGVEYRDFSDAQPSVAELLMAWRIDSRNPLVPLVVDLAVSPEGAEKAA